MTIYRQSKRVRCLGVVVCGCLPLLGASIVAAGEIHVYAPESIQAAIGGASGDDEIIVHPGTYPESINFGGKAITVRSSGGADVTTINATGLSTSVVTCATGEGPNTILEGFTITGGWGTDLGGFELRGGGIFITGSSPMIKDCRFSSNSAMGGAGGYASGSGATFDGCRFENNTAEAWGHGGGLLVEDSSVTIEDCAFVTNHARGPQGDGGGLYVSGGSMTLVNSTFHDNDAEFTGGGICTVGCALTAVNLLVIANSADGGGGLRILAGAPTFINCTITENSGYTAGGGVYHENATTSFANCILYDNTSLWEPEIYHGGSGTVSVTYSNVEGEWSGAGNIDTDPMFADASSLDFRLLAGSLCIDAGDSGAVPGWVSTDLDGAPRIVDDPDTDDTGVGFPCVDMGAFERQATRPPCPADLTNDGKVDECDLCIMISAWGPCSDPCPPSCSADLTEDCVVDICDVFALLGYWGPCP